MSNDCGFFSVEIILEVFTCTKWFLRRLKLNILRVFINKSGLMLMNKGHLQS